MLNLQGDGTGFEFMGGEIVSICIFNNNDTLNSIP